MCGIVGFLNFDGRPVSYKILNEMNESLFLRGPDDSGIYIKKNFGMAMRRLSIIDLHTGAQPIFNNDKSLVLVFNGEIYNYIEIKKKLESKGIQFNTNSDSEVIIHLYQKYGENLVEYLNGMFAFCIFDLKNKKIFISRDRIGIKPLVYYNDKNIFAFASSLNTLKIHPNIQGEISYDNFLSFFSSSYIATPISIYNNFHKLKPGHSLIIQNNKVIEKCYWKINPTKNYNIKNFKYDEHIYEIKYLLEDSIKINSRSDVPIGTFLSGGIDSTYITSILSKNNLKNLHTFSASFLGKKNNEDSLALQSSYKYKTNHHRLIINGKNLIDGIEECVKIIDEPIADSSIIPSYLLSKLAAENNIKVILTGAGGDEIFGGYSRHYTRKKDFITSFFSTFSLSLIFNFSKILGKNFFNKNIKLMNKEIDYALNISGLDTNLFAYSLNRSSNFYQMIKNLKNQFEEINNLRTLYGYSYGSMVTDIENYLVDDILALTDKSSMTASVEARVPFLDHRLIEKVFSLPQKYIINNQIHKYTLKKLINKDLDNSILNHPKTGFNGPIIHWFDFIHKDFENVFSNIKSPILNEIFNKKKIYEIWKNKKTRIIGSEFLFMIFISEKWLSNNE